MKTDIETAEQFQESSLPDDLNVLMTQDELRAKIKKMEKEYAAMEADPEADERKKIALMVDIAIARGKLAPKSKGGPAAIPGIEYR